MAGCGSDSSSKKKSKSKKRKANATKVLPGAAAAVLTQESVREFIDAINENPAIVCDPENATASFLESAGGQEGCAEAAAQEEGGQPYEVKDLQIEGETATAVIEDAESTSTVTFVTEGDEIKVSGSD